jgi:hypothetical protein
VSGVITLGGYARPPQGHHVAGFGDHAAAGVRDGESVTERPRAVAGPERWRLSFAAVVSDEFAFLLGLGFRVVEMNDTLVRYESDRRLVQVFHGRGSYELGVGIGRWIEVKVAPAEQVFPSPT